MVGNRLGMASLAARLFASRISPVLLYHSTFVDVPEDLGTRVHNVHPDILIEQVSWLAEQFEFITIDEWFARNRPMGTACVTFDDGYRSVCEEALPRLIELGIPSTVFLNGASLRGEIFWRDRVVFLVNRGLASDFLVSSHAKAAGLDDMNPDDFYDRSRRPDRSSRTVDHAVEAYLTESGLIDEVGRHIVFEPDQLVDHHLVSYGCHTFRHYVPSSLTAEEQEEEFVENQRLLAELDVQRSNVFSIPFGGLRVLDETTKTLIRRLGFDGVVFSRHAVNFRRPTDFDGIPAAERYMVPGDLAGLQERHLRLGAMDPQAPARRAVRRAADLVRR